MRGNARRRVSGKALKRILFHIAVFDGLDAGCQGRCWRHRSEGPSWARTQAIVGNRRAQRQELSPAHGRREPIMGDNSSSGGRGGARAAGRIDARSPKRPVHGSWLGVAPLQLMQLVRTKHRAAASRAHAADLGYP